jgi:hypothetical protein
MIERRGFNGRGWCTGLLVSLWPSPATHHLPHSARP